MKGKQKRVALIGLPVLQAVNNLTNAAIAKYAEETNRWRFVFSAEASVEAFQFLRRLDCDGALVRILSPAMRREAMRIRCPLVNVSSWLDAPGVPTIRHDFAAIGRLAAEHLLEKGYRRIGCVLVAGGAYIQSRYHAAAETLRARGVRPLLFHLRTTQPLNPQPLTPEERQRFINWVKGFQPPAGLVLMDDWDAPALMECCIEAGLHIPRDIVMISTGIHSEMVPLFKVPLSAAQEDQERQAFLAIQYLDELMAGKKLARPIVEIPPAGVVERTSTATLAIEDREVAQAVEFIRAHGFEPVNVADVAGKVRISRVTLERRFLQVTGQTMHKYLTAHRIQRAQELLSARPAMSLQNIARQCGFADRRRLNLVFRQIMGRSPAAWHKHPSAGPGKSKPRSTDVIPPKTPG